jgi:hypothetical protein
LTKLLPTIDLVFIKERALSFKISDIFHRRAPSTGLDDEIKYLNIIGLLKFNCFLWKESILINCKLFVVWSVGFVLRIQFVIIK